MDHTSARVRRWIARSLLPLATALAGCAQSELPLTQVVVTISGDELVLRQLKRIDAKIYPTDAPEGSQPTARHTFALPATTPITFGINRGQADRFLLVVEGYGSDDTRERPFIERKQRAQFAEARTLQLDVFLAEACFRPSRNCFALSHTCRADARACMPVPDATLSEVVPGEERAPTPARPPASEACATSGCPSDYPCVPTGGSSYTCLGHFADWPMPDSTAGSAHAPSYDTATPGMVRDRVTGLTWQRDLPATYPGCSGVLPADPTPGSLCSWDEAKIYCQQLTLEGLAWRLPSKIELESIVDTQASGFAIPQDLFPGCEGDYWTSSSEPADDPTKPFYFDVDAQDGTAGRAPPERGACVRCVAGTPAAQGKPDDRYLADADGTVLDTRTRLRWQASVSEPLDTVEAAVAYCAARGGGQRLPSYKELLTLVDPTRELPAMSPVFGPTPAGNYWTVRGRVAGGTGVRLVRFQSGDAIAEGLHIDAYNSGKPRARCVQ